MAADNYGFSSHLQIIGHRYESRESFRMSQMILFDDVPVFNAGLTVAFVRESPFEFYCLLAELLKVHPLKGWNHFFDF